MEQNRNGLPDGQALPVKGDYRHVRRVVLAVAAVVIGGLALKAFLVPKTYGQFGAYRGAAYLEQREARTPVYQGASVCAECHDDVVALHDKDVHMNVECENCHGPADRHVAFMHGDLKDAKGPEIDVPQTKDACLICHRRLAARPATFPQIDPKEHYALMEVRDEKTPCFSCHSPHEPLFLEKKLTEARQHPMIYQCANCHREKVDAGAALPDKHPAVFRCSYCHSELAADFEKRPHGRLGCGICHQFYVESETAGRIVKHRDPRFCLLCHQERPFVQSKNKPLISWPAHRSDVSFDPADQNKVCADCHRDAFHKAFLKPAPENPGKEKNP